MILAALLGALGGFLAGFLAAGHILTSPFDRHVAESLALLDEDDIR